MNIFRFPDRAGILDQRSQRFLMTVAWLGGYVAPEQAQELGIRNSVPRVHGQLKDLESRGFIKRSSTYPAVSASCISGSTSSSNVRPENSPSRWLSTSAARSRESLTTLTGGTRLDTPRFRLTVTTSSAAATGYVPTLQADLSCGLALHRF